MKSIFPFLTTLAVSTAIDVPTRDLIFDLEMKIVNSFKTKDRIQIASHFDKDFTYTGCNDRELNLDEYLEFYTDKIFRQGFSGLLKEANRVSDSRIDYIWEEDKSSGRYETIKSMEKKGADWVITVASKARCVA